MTQESQNAKDSKNGEFFLKLPNSDKSIRIVWSNKSNSANNEHNVEGVFGFQDEKLSMTYIYDYEFEKYRGLGSEKKYEVKQNIDKLPCYYLFDDFLKVPQLSHSFHKEAGNDIWNFRIQIMRQNMPGDWYGGSQVFIFTYRFDLTQKLCTHTYYYRGDGGE